MSTIFDKISAALPELADYDLTQSSAELKNRISVMDFGAVGDGVTDDTAAIQSALSFAVSSGRDLFIPTGSYKVTSTINLVSQPSATTTPLLHSNTMFSTQPPTSPTVGQLWGDILTLKYHIWDGSNWQSIHP